MILFLLAAVLAAVPWAMLLLANLGWRLFRPPRAGLWAALRLCTIIALACSVIAFFVHSGEPNNQRVPALLAVLQTATLIAAGRWLRPPG